MAPLFFPVTRGTVWGSAGTQLVDNIAHMIKNPHFLRTHLKFKIISQLGRQWLAFKNKLVRQETWTLWSCWNLRAATGTLLQTCWGHLTLTWEDLRCWWHKEQQLSDCCRRKQATYRQNHITSWPHVPVCSNGACSFWFWDHFWDIYFRIKNSEPLSHRGNKNMVEL